MTLDEVPTAAHNGTQGADTRARIVVAMLAMEHPTIPALCLATGRTRSVIHHQLHALKREGIVDWEPGRKGTLHLLVRPVAFG